MFGKKTVLACREKRLKSSLPDVENVVKNSRDAQSIDCFYPRVGCGDALENLQERGAMGLRRA